MIMSNAIFMWIVTALSVGICLASGGRDVYLLCKVLPRRGREVPPDQAIWRDQVFGSAMGVVLAVTGLLGVFKYHLNW